MAGTLCSRFRLTALRPSLSRSLPLTFSLFLSVASIFHFIANVNAFPAISTFFLERIPNNYTIYTEYSSERKGQKHSRSGLKIFVLCSQENMQVIWLYINLYTVVVLTTVSAPITGDGKDDSFTLFG